jgi:hypothetical protein
MSSRLSPTLIYIPSELLAAMNVMENPKNLLSSHVLKNVWSGLGKNVMDTYSQFSFRKH